MVNKTFGFEVYDVLQRMTRSNAEDRPAFYELRIEIEDIGELRRRLQNPPKVVTREQ